ncbi:MAG TPA: hypothetical protein VJA21_25270 [Verrucomicrobiae bacterium]
MMEAFFASVLGIVVYFCGLFVWPACAFFWRNNRRRTMALRLVFFCQLLLDLVLAGFLIFSRGLMEHQYGWLFLMLVVNIIFTPAALIGAVYDSAHPIKPAA